MHYSVASCWKHTLVWEENVCLEIDTQRKLSFVYLVSAKLGRNKRKLKSFGCKLLPTGSSNSRKKTYFCWKCEVQLYRTHPAAACAGIFTWRINYNSRTVARERVRSSLIIECALNNAGTTRANYKRHLVAPAPSFRIVNIFGRASNAPV